MGRLIRLITRGLLVICIAIVGIAQPFAYPILYILLIAAPIIHGIGLFWGVVVSIIGYVLTGWLGVLLTGMVLTPICAGLVLMLEKLNLDDCSKNDQLAEQMEAGLISHVIGYIDLMISELNQRKTQIDRSIKIILICQAWAITYFYHKQRSPHSDKCLIESRVKKDFFLITRQISIDRHLGVSLDDKCYSEIKSMLFLMHSKSEQVTPEGKAFKLTIMYCKRLSQNFSDPQALSDLAETLFDPEIREKLKSAVSEYGTSIHI